MSVTRKQIKTILNKGDLTGFEVSKIVMHDLYEAHKISEPDLFDEEDGNSEEKMKERLLFYDGDELENLKLKVLYGDKSKTNAYNHWINAFHPFVGVVHKAHIYQLKISGMFDYLRSVLMRYKMAALMDYFVQTTFQENFKKNNGKNHKGQKQKKSSKEKKINRWDLFINSPLLNPDQEVTKSYGTSVRNIFMCSLLRTRWLISHLLFYRCISQILTDEFGITFLEKSDKWYAEIKNDLKYFELFLEQVVKINLRAKKELDGIQGIIDLQDLQIPDILENKFRKEFTRDNLYCWITICQEMFYDHEAKKDEGAYIDRPTGCCK